MTESVVIITEAVPEPYHFNPRLPIRGTDKFYVKTAKSAVELGYECDVIYDGPRDFVDGVCYFSRADTDLVLSNRPARLIVCNPRGDQQNLRGRSRHLTATRTTIWTNLFIPGSYREWLRDIPVTYSDIVVISSYARDLMCADAPSSRPRVVPHGIDRSIYYPPQAGSVREKDVVFSSSPDRGWDVLRRIWATKDTNGYALVTGAYGTTQVSDREMAGLLRSASFWVHPGVDSELFCLAAVEAQACGCTPIVVPLGALSETVKFGIRAPRADFEAVLLATLHGQTPFQGVNADHVGDWLPVTKQLID